MDVPREGARRVRPHDLDADEARAESPALREPRPGARLIAVAGGDELPEFRRQNLLLPTVWHGLRAETAAFEIAGTHHFSVIQGLADPEIKERFDALGLVPIGNSPEQFLAKTKEQHARYGKVIREQNIKPE